MATDDLTPEPSTNSIATTVPGHQQPPYTFSKADHTQLLQTRASATDPAPCSQQLESSTCTSTPDIAPVIILCIFRSGEDRKPDREMVDVSAKSLDDLVGCFMDEQVRSPIVELIDLVMEACAHQAEVQDVVLEVLKGSGSLGKVLRDLADQFDGKVR
ncbi:hypothetical protein MMC13_005308 [Lambiella insularis]|nr:hypothetical protein [Lambiella insularis]